MLIACSLLTVMTVGSAGEPGVLGTKDEQAHPKQRKGWSEREPVSAQDEEFGAKM